MRARVEAVALDAMGVIYPVADDLRDLLIPYLRSKGCTVPDQQIIEAYRACYRQGAPAETIWRASGCDWQDGSLGRDYLACYELNPGVIEFLESMRSSSIPVYGLSNDVAEWASARRRLLGIDQYFEGWAISAEVGRPKPAPEIYQRLIDMLPCPAEACVFVDDRAENLEAAQAFGLQTVLFGRPAYGGGAVADFGELTTHVAGRPMRPETEAAIEVVRRGLDLAEAHLGTRDVTAKDGRDIVTAADVAVEDLIRTNLQQAFAHPVVGEERGGEPPADGAPYWLVDPICGTRNFASGNRLYCINLALVQEGQVIAAAVGDPLRNEVLYAERGQRAWSLHDGAKERLTVSSESRTIVVEEGKSAGLAREHAARFMAEVVRTNRWDFRSLGTTLALPYLAAGRIAAYVVLYVSAVHSAAGSLLVEEAGGGLWDLTGAPWTLQSDTLLFTATTDLRSDLLEIVASTIP